MLVPQFWAEGRAHKPRETRDARQVTVRRWGWSDDSQEAAQRHADQRAQDALAGVLAGDDRVKRREPKVPYNGAEGVPIREEIVARHGDTVITRNSYGALCLNTPNVLFADVDFLTPPHGEGCLGCLGAVIGFFVGVGLLTLVALTGSPFVAAVAGLLGMLGGTIVGAVVGVTSLGLAVNAYTWIRGGKERISLRRVRRAISNNPTWSLRLYRMPSGYRVLATHALFQPNDDETIKFFRALGTDRVYVAMCRKQSCFRARLTPKPWRIGYLGHLKPRPGVWPIAPDRLHERERWVNRYEQASKDYAACRYIDTLGSAMTCPEALEVQRLHDELCKAHSDLPIA